MDIRCECFHCNCNISPTLYATKTKYTHVMAIISSLMMILLFLFDVWIYESLSASALEMKWKVEFKIETSSCHGELSQRAYKLRQVVSKGYHVFLFISFVMFYSQRHTEAYYIETDIKFTHIQSRKAMNISFFSLSTCF